MKSIGIVNIGITGSRISGYIRDMSIASSFGANFITDAFFVAFTIPNMLRQLLGEGALSVAFIPIFTRYFGKDKKEAWRLGSIVVNLLFVISSLIAILGIIFSPIIIKIIAPGFKGEEAYPLAVKLTRIMFPFVILISLSALIMGILNSCRHFFLPAIAPILLNLGMIASIYLLCPAFTQPIIGLAIGVLIGGFGYLIIQIPGLIKHKMRYQLTFDLSHPGLREISHLFIPAILGLAASQMILIFIGRILASYLVVGSVSFLYFANRLIQLPTSLFGVAIATVSFPSISEYAAINQPHKVKDTFLYSLKMVIFTTIPVTIGLIILGKPIIQVLFQRGEFSEASVQDTYSCLFYYSFGLIGYSSLKVIIRTFYALKDAITPLKVGLLIILVNVILSLILMRPLEASGLALATSISSLLNVSILLIILEKRIGHMVSKEMLIFFLRVLFAAGIMGLICLFLITKLQITLILRVSITIIAGIISLFFISRFLHIEEANLILKVLKPGYK
ncbi:MAG: murein biosynthesis integral membrane protein MurJ [bacterium]|nr:murein biosynthesis integral membrane protein MurJ [bacterium]